MRACQNGSVPRALSRAGISEAPTGGFAGRAAGTLGEALAGALGTASLMGTGAGDSAAREPWGAGAGSPPPPQPATQIANAHAVAAPPRIAPSRLSGAQYSCLAQSVTARQMPVGICRRAGLGFGSLASRGNHPRTAGGKREHCGGQVVT